MNEQEAKNLAIFKQVAQDIRDGKRSFTEANRYLDSIDFDPDYRYPGLHINDDGVMQQYIWKKGRWEQVDG